MKKLFKFIIALSAIIGGIAGALYLLDKKREAEYEDFDDEDMDDIFNDDEADRDYVTLDFEKKEEDATERQTEPNDVPLVLWTLIVPVG